MQREGVGEIGIIMRRDAASRELASKALKLVDDYGFGDLVFSASPQTSIPITARRSRFFLRARLSSAKGLFAQLVENPPRHPRRHHHGQAARLA